MCTCIIDNMITMILLRTNDNDNHITNSNSNDNMIDNNVNTKSHANA